MAPSSIIARNDELYGRGTNLLIISIIFNLTSFYLVVSRIFSRFVKTHSLGWDDLAIVLSQAFVIGLTTCNAIAVAHGFGKGDKALDLSDGHTALQAFYALQILYKFTINLTKISICLLYLRIFPARKFRKVVYCVMTYVVAYGIASIVATILQCTPVARVWNKALPGTCIDLTIFWYCNAGANIVGDLLILLPPMPGVRRLQLPKAQKWGLYLIFGLGGFVCITSILRMTTLDASSKSIDPLFGALNSTIWTTIEANTAIICACLPMQRRSLAALFPKLFPRDPATRYTYGNSTSLSQRETPSNAVSAWGPLESETNAQTNMPRSPLGFNSNTASRDDSFGMELEDIPLGRIKKTTQVKVQEADDHCFPVSSSNANPHNMSVSNSVGLQNNNEHVSIPPPCHH